LAASAGEIVVVVGSAVVVGASVTTAGDVDAAVVAEELEDELHDAASRATGSSNRAGRRIE
jgi:hypothetical protein